MSPASFRMAGSAPFAIKSLLRPILSGIRVPETQKNGGITKDSLCSADRDQNGSREDCCCRGGRCLVWQDRLGLTCEQLLLRSPERVSVTPHHDGQSHSPSLDVQELFSLQLICIRKHTVLFNESVRREAHHPHRRFSRSVPRSLYRIVDHGCTAVNRVPVRSRCGDVRMDHVCVHFYCGDLYCPVRSDF